MNFNDLDIDKFGQIPLSQKKFKDGALIATGIKDKKEYIAIDVRFYVRMEKGWLPTKNGFWVAKENWRVLEKILKKKYESIGEKVCWETASRKFIIRYISKYGGGIDFRYYCKNAKYTGWEKKGIRIAKKDYSKVKTLIIDAIRRPEKVVCSRKFNVIQTDRKKRLRKNKSADTSNSSKIINPALMEILGG